MDRAARKLRLMFCVVNDSVARYFLKLLVDLISSGQLAAALPRYRLELVRCETQDEALARLRRYGSEPEPQAVMLISDALVESVADVRATESWMPSYWAKDVADAIGPCGVTIAIMQVPRRVADIDRALPRSATSAQLLATLTLAADKLTYMSRPEKRAYPSPFEVRLIRWQHELLEYFRLRHRIYKIMGYLRDEIENAPSQLEIDWCDSIALHCGAYERLRDGRETLVGTARVVIASSATPHKHANQLALYKQWTEKLAAGDPVLNQALANQVLELELPIFHSQNLSGIFRQVVQSDEVCGELSRVIVAEDYRGAGLSRQLVEFALAEAGRAGIKRLFLECLDVHQELYGKFGFQRLDGARGTVIGVNKTMLAMELYPLVGRELPLPPAKAPALPPAASDAAESRGHA
jgi:predicted GNAT family N-acyltransferase